MPAIYTRSGDAGMTGILGAGRVPKQSLQVEAYGSVDEAGAAIGAAKAKVADPACWAALDGMQARLFWAAAELASDGTVELAERVEPADTAWLEVLIDECVAVVGPQKKFVTPGEDEVSAALHQARAVVRRAERRVLSAAEAIPVRPELVAYLNRASDALHALALVAAFRGKVERTVRAAFAKFAGVGDLAGDFDLRAAKRGAEAAEAKALELGIPIVFAAVDPGGNLVLLHRMADSLLASLELAIGKAYTSAALKQPTGDLYAQTVPGGALYGIENSDRRIVVFGGGLPVFSAAKIAGGIGVSGGTVEQDEIIAGAALAAIKEA
jgi:ATP:cob(I)alamin adenosyltransferase